MDCQAACVRSLVRCPRLGHEAHFTSVAMLMRLLGYSLQANVKTKEGASHPDRDAQFQHINQAAKAAVAAGWPVISVDCKKKELIGDFKNGGREWHLKGKPELVRVHDFKDKKLGKAIQHTASTTSSSTRGMSTSASTTTPPSSRSTRSRAWWEHLRSRALPERSAC